MANQKNNRENNFINNTLMGVGLTVMIMFIMFVIIKGNEISDLFYSFLGSIVEFIPYVVGGVIIYGMGRINTSREYRNANNNLHAKNARLKSENTEMKDLLSQAAEELDNRDTTIKELREELREYKNRLNMSQIVNMPGGNDTPHTSNSHLQTSNKEI